METGDTAELTADRPILRRTRTKRFFPAQGSERNRRIVPTLSAHDETQTLVWPPAATRLLDSKTNSLKF